MGVGQKQHGCLRECRKAFRPLVTLTAVLHGRQGFQAKEAGVGMPGGARVWQNWEASGSTVCWDIGGRTMWLKNQGADQAWLGRMAGKTSWNRTKNTLECCAYPYRKQETHPDPSFFGSIDALQVQCRLTEVIQEVLL